MDTKKIAKYMLPSGYYHIGKMQQELAGDKTSTTILDFFGNSDSEQPMIDDSIPEIAYAMKYNADKQSEEETEELPIIQAAYNRAESGNASRDDWKLLIAVNLTRT